MILVTLAAALVRSSGPGRRPVNTALRLDLCPDTLIGEDLEQYCMIDTAIDNGHGRHAAINRIECTANFRQHAAFDGAVGNQTITHETRLRFQSKLLFVDHKSMIEPNRSVL